MLNNRKWQQILAAGMLFAMFSVCGCGKTAAPAPAATGSAVESKEDAKERFAQSCGACHGINRIEQYSGKEPWKDIVDRMIVKHGAKVSAEDAGRIVAYLDKTYLRK